MKKKIKPQNYPLKCSIRNQQLIIQIGISTLADCTEQQAEAELYDGDDTLPVKLPWHICDATEFAKDVASEMQCEDEAGASPLTNFIDQMCIAAVNNGTIRIEFDEDKTKKSKSRKRKR